MGWGVDIRKTRTDVENRSWVAICIAARAEFEGPSRAGAEKKKHVHETKWQVSGVSSS